MKQWDYEYVTVKTVYYGIQFQAIVFLLYFFIILGETSSSIQLK